MLIFNTKVFNIPSKDTNDDIKIFLYIEMHMRDLTRTVVTKIVHRANSLTTFRLPCMGESRVNRP